MKKYIFLIFSILINQHALFAQIDTEFWFAAPEVTSLHADRPIYLRISALDQPAEIYISEPANPNFKPRTVKLDANSTTTVDLTSDIDILENKPADQVLNFGLHIESSAEITAYYEVFGSQGSSLIGVNSEIFVLKGDHALGTSFFVPMQTHWDNNPSIDAWSSFDIVATEDNTTINITPTQNVVGHNAGIPYVVNLNRGQTYSARASSPLGSLHPAGSYISSSKQIAVTMKDDSVLEEDHWDLVGDQIIPVNITGSSYIAVKVSDSSNTDRIYICATQDNTDIFLDGGSVATATINKGQTYEYQVLLPTAYITTSNPSYAFHVCGFSQELGGATLPPIGCTGSRQVEFTRSTDEEFALAILVKAGYEGFFSINGISNAILPIYFSDVNGTGGQWKYANIPFDANFLPAGKPILVKNDQADFQIATLNGAYNTGFRYGYFSDYGFLNLGTQKFLCKGDNITLNAGYGKSSYSWIYQNTGQNISNEQTITVADSGAYKVTVTKGICTFSDSVDISFLPAVTTPILGNDTAVCSNVDFHVYALDNYPRYVWQDSSSLNNYKPATSGFYWLDAFNDSGCKKRDSIYITLYDIPHPQISFNPDLDSYCKDSVVRLQVSTPFTNYLWYNGDTTISTTTSHNEELDVYSVVVTDYHGCKNADTATIDCSTVTGLIPNLITKNGDGKNDNFKVEYLRSSHWVMEVYNTWGNRVYYNTTYRNTNPFDGIGLSDDVYYYVLRHNEGKKLIKGWIQINSGGGN